MPKKELDAYQRVCAERDKHGERSRIDTIHAITAQKITRSPDRASSTTDWVRGYIEDLDKNPDSYVKLAKDELSFSDEQYETFKKDRKKGMKLLGNEIHPQQHLYRAAALCYATASTLKKRVEGGLTTTRMLGILNDLHKEMGAVEKSAYHRSSERNGLGVDSNTFDKLNQTKKLYQEIKDSIRYERKRKA